MPDGIDSRARRVGASAGSSTSVVVGALLALVIGVLLTRNSERLLITGVLLAVAPVAALAIASLSLETLMKVLIAGCQVSLVSVGVAGLNFRPEHFVLVALVVALVVRAPHLIIRRLALFEWLFLGWVVWNAVSVIDAPDVQESAAIAGWIALAWLILYATRGVFASDGELFERCITFGIQFAAFIGAAAFLTWVLALAGVGRWLVQGAFRSDVVAAKGLSFEANLFASQELFWLLWVIRRKILDDRRTPPWQTLALVLGIIAALTRATWVAAIVCMIGALGAKRAAWPGGSRPAASRRLQRITWALAILLVALGLGTPAGERFTQTLDFKTGTGAARLVTMSEAWRDLERSGAYLTGLGTHSFGARHMSHTLRKHRDYLGSLPMTVLYDTGFVGLLLFLGGMIGVSFRARDAPTRILNLTFVVALLIVGTATNPIWFGFVWLSVAGIDADSRKRSLAMVAGLVRVPLEKSPRKTLRAK